MTIEYRSFTGAETVDATDDGVIFGLAIPYNRETVIGDLAHGGFREQVAPGSCTKSLKEADIVALWNHDSKFPLGRTSAGNLMLKNTTRGVEPELRPLDTSYADDLMRNVKGKIVKGWSFGFEVVRDEWTDDEGKPSDELRGTNRVIREMKLREVSPCTFPAYDMTDIASRSGSLMERREAFQAEGDAGPRDDQPPEDRGGNAPGNGKKPYGNVPYADPGYQPDGKKRYPVDTVKHIRAAWAYISKPKNAGKYTSSQLAKIKSRIKAAAKKAGVSTGGNRTSPEELDLIGYCPFHGFEDDPETRDSVVVVQRKSKLAKGTLRRIPQIDTALKQALDLLAEAGQKSLPQKAQDAIALLSGAAEHSGHIMKTEGLKSADANARTTEPKPAETTSADVPSDDALIAQYMQAVSREVALGI